MLSADAQLHENFTMPGRLRCVVCDGVIRCFCGDLTVRVVSVAESRDYASMFA